MLNHIKCNNTVRLDISEVVSICGDLALTKDLSYLTVTQISVRLRKNYKKKLNIIFDCEKCGIIPEEEVGGYCLACGDNFSKESLFIPEDSGGTYCKPHIERNFHDERSIPLSEALKKSVQINF